MLKVSIHLATSHTTVLCVAYNYFISKDRDEKSGNTVGWKWFGWEWKYCCMEMVWDENGNTVGWKWFWMRIEILLDGNGLGWEWKHVGWERKYVGIWDDRRWELYVKHNQTLVKPYIYINISLYMTQYYFNRSEYSLIKLLLNFSFPLSTLFKMTFNYVYNSFCYKWAT